MKQVTCKIILLSLMCLAIAWLGTAREQASEESGTLVFDVMNYTSDVKLSKQVKESLEHGGVRWGMAGNTLVVSLVNEKFVKADLPNLTRFGDQKTIALKAGDYTITCIGFEFKSTSNDPEKVLSKSGFFNSDILAFAILPGKNTNLDISPVFEAQAHRKMLAKITLFSPDLSVVVMEDGKEKGQAVINRRNDRSVAWDDYHGPLKF